MNIFYQPYQRKPKKMAEPTSSGVASYAVYKIFFAYGLPACLASIIVMLLTQPRSPRVWTLALLSTVASSIYGGAFAIRYFGLHKWSEEVDSAVMLGGVYLVCGLPAWVIVRASFAWAEKRKSKDLQELVKDAAQAVKEVKNGF